MNNLNSHTNFFNNTSKSLDATPQLENKLNFNEICNFKMEINKLVEENIYLKTQLIDIKSKINQYDSIIEKTDLKYQDQINNYQKQIIKYNSYIHEIYIFFSNITKKYIPELNFTLEKTESLLINFDLFQKNLKYIEKYICELKKKVNRYTNISLNNRIITDINSNNTNNTSFQNNGYYLTEFNKDTSILEERINNLEKTIINKGCYNKINNRKIPSGKNKNINNSLVSKYHYGNNNIKEHTNKQFRKINYINNIIKYNERFKSALGKNSYSSKKSSSELKTKNRYFNKNNDLKFLKKSIPFKPKRTMTPLPK